MSSSAPPVREVRTEYANGSYRAKSILSPEGYPVRALVKLYPRQVIPIVFLPGIMGTNLRLRNGGGMAWRPPNGKARGLVEVLRYLIKDAAERKKCLHPDAVEVDDTGPINVTSKTHLLVPSGNSSVEKAAAGLDGWRELHQESYSFILNVLQENLHDIFDYSGDPCLYWKKNVLEAQGKKEFGAEKEFTAVTEAELRKFATAAYPVHAIGYNWLQSNAKSAADVARRIDAIIAFYRDTLRKDCEKVILVTHSMGGLVARALTQLVGYPNVAGIVHGVMPAIGAPATYKRMRAGFEGVEQVLLGRNAAESTAVLTQACGPLELLPTAEYATQHGGHQQHWLEAEYVSRDARVPNTKNVLGPGDPYSAIYLNRSDWWRLVKTELINPADETRAAEPYGDRDFKAFKKNLNLVEAFHADIKQKYHVNTYAFYAADPERRTWTHVRWSASSPGRDFRSGQILSDDLNGKVTVKFADSTQDLEIAEPSGLGDGTVPEFSGAAPTRYVRQIFRHGGTSSGHVSYEHQNGYGSNFTAGLTLYSIVRLVLDSRALREASNA